MGCSRATPHVAAQTNMTHPHHTHGKKKEKKRRAGRIAQHTGTQKSTQHCSHTTHHATPRPSLITGTQLEAIRPGFYSATWRGCNVELLEDSFRLVLIYIKLLRHTGETPPYHTSNRPPPPPTTTPTANEKDQPMTINKHHGTCH